MTRDLRLDTLRGLLLVLLGSDTGRQAVTPLLRRTWLRSLICLCAILFFLSRHTVILPEMVADKLDTPLKSFRLRR